MFLLSHFLARSWFYSLYNYEGLMCLLTVCGCYSASSPLCFYKKRSKRNIWDHHWYVLGISIRSVVAKVVRRWAHDQLRFAGSNPDWVAVFAFLGKTLSLDCLSPPRCINVYLFEHVCKAVAAWWQINIHLHKNRMGLSCEVDRKWLAVLAD